MIILRVEAERLHRYRVLRLADLPERGIIALSGDNESGKSGIGEIICFALFGRSYALAPDRIGKLVHWGAGQGAVTLQFRAKGRRYQVVRQLTRDGEQSARLVLAEQPETLLARGGEAVTSAIEERLGYGFDAYIETFYLAQREITMPQPHSPAVRAMVGVMPLERCAAELAAETAAAGEEQARHEGRLAELEAELDRLSSDHAHLEELEENLARISEHERITAERIQALETTGDAYCDTCRSQRAHGLRRAMARILANLVLAALVVSASLWALLYFQGETWPMPNLRAWMEAWLGAPGLPVESLLAYLGYGLGGLLALLWLWLGILAMATRRWRMSARRLVRELDRLDALGLEGAPGGGRRHEIAATGYAMTADSASVLDKPDAERRARLQRRILSLNITAAEVRVALTHELSWLRRRLAELGAEHKAEEGKLERARADQMRHGRLARERGELESRRTVLRERVATYRLACQLLAGAAHSLSERFSEHLRGMVSRALPQFTEGRYDHLSVDEEFQVRVYSSDKRNLLDLDEISSGTQRQIMLALRLGLSQELVSRLVEDDQFAFLDEPFAFFDSRRMRGALRTLSELGGEVVQHWVVAQRFPQDAHMGIEIPCGRHPDTLEIGLPETD